MNSIRHELTDMALYMRNPAMCDEFLRVAHNQYPEFLSRVRHDAARAMSSWLVLYGYRPVIQWSEDDECFIGCLRNIGARTVGFHGKTAVALQQAFEDATRDYVTGRAKHRATKDAQASGAAAA